MRVACPGFALNRYTRRVDSASYIERYNLVTYSLHVNAVRGLKILTGNTLLFVAAADQVLSCYFSTLISRRVYTAQSG